MSTPTKHAAVRQVLPFVRIWARKTIDTEVITVCRVCGITGTPDAEPAVRDHELDCGYAALKEMLGEGEA